MGSPENPINPLSPENNKRGEINQEKEKSEKGDVEISTLKDEMAADWLKEAKLYNPETQSPPREITVLHFTGEITKSFAGKKALPISEIIRLIEELQLSIPSDISKLENQVGIVISQENSCDITFATAY